MKVFCGIDVGASQTKAALLDERGSLLAGAVLKSGVDFEKAAENALARALEAAGLERKAVSSTVACGYGRHNVPFADRARTELACHARGAFHQVRTAITVVDIGGQDNKVLRIGADGRLITFKMNRKCAAGTGAFLEEIALRVDVPLERMNHIAEGSDGEVSLGSFCTVFTATEILAHIRRGVALAHLVKGAFRSVIKRIVEMDPLEGDVWLGGGVVAHNPVLVPMFSEELGRPAHILEHAEKNGAIGAALLAMEDS